ncbi:hypothetical protein [Nannocystis bainbridge]|uniref:Myxococcus cysteine-rich repeat-containing protein n=1 Tax=Nannocystis bainbridge TaxID=2995303 RepID=A0ABT5DXQ1_9BACT|nr:hypothetical protein [Nannocystis bainbridge]MDC0717226.1 hypothetical protein [Nannocystis bainbridge]
MSARIVAARPCAPQSAAAPPSRREADPPGAPQPALPRTRTRPRRRASPPSSSPAVLLAALALAPACFSDDGYHPAGATALTTDADATSTTTTTGTTGPEPPATTTSTTGEPAPVCGDGVVDPDEDCDDGNRDDGDACLATCVAAGCGDGEVWLGVEACDQGAANHPTAPDTCRPTCELPACGDGGLYVGPLGPDIEVPTGEEAIGDGDDAPRILGAAADGSFVVAWRVTNIVARVQARRVDPSGEPLGEVIELVEQPFLQVRDPVVAALPNGDFAVAWQSQFEDPQLLVRGVAADELAPAFKLTNRVAASPALALDPSGALIAAYRAGGTKQTTQIYLRRFPLFTESGSPDEQAISEHTAGAAGSPTIAVHPDGSFLVAWSDPEGAIVYRRFTPDLVAGPLVPTGLHVGGGTSNSALPWIGAAFQPTTGTAVIAGRDPDDRLVLQQFDPGDLARGRVQVDDLDALYIPFVDVASDPWGNLAVAWSTCGGPEEVEPNCADLASVSSFRWFYADLTPQGPAAVVTTREGMPHPLSLAVAATGAAAVARVEDNKVLLNMSPVQCPP